MKLSLTTIIDQLDLHNINIVKSIKIRGFYKHVRVRVSNSVFYSDVVYIADVPSDNDKYLPGDSCIFYCQPCRLPDNINCCCLCSPYDLYEILNMILELFDRYNNYESRVIELLRRHSPLQDIIDLYTEVFRNPTYLIDSSFKVLAIDMNPELPELSLTWKRLRERGYMPIDKVKSLLDNKNWLELNTEHRATLVTPYVPYWTEFYIPFINYNLFTNNKIQGHFFVVAIYGAIRDGDLDLVDSFANYIMEGMTSDSIYSESRGKYYEHFLIDLMSGGLRDKELIKEQLIPLGWKLEDSYCLLTINAENQSPSLLEFISSRLESLEGGKPVTFNNKFYCIFPIRNDKHFSFLTYQLEVFFANMCIPCALSMCFDGFHHLQHHVVQADYALDEGTRMYPLCFIHKYEDFIIHHIFSASSNMIHLRDVYERAITTLRKIDNSSSSQYCETLSAYLLYERSLVQTASELGIHRNTLLHRIDRIKEIVDIDLDNPDKRFRLMLSFKIQEYLNSKNENKSRHKIDYV